jgi:tetratricopeptide (TPR) repeat protein
VKVEPEEAAWWINLAYATRRAESVEKAEKILLRARELHHDALIEFNLACHASVIGQLEDARVRLRHAIEIDKEIPDWRWITSSAPLVGVDRYFGIASRPPCPKNPETPAVINLANTRELELHLGHLGAMRTPPSKPSPKIASVMTHYAPIILSLHSKIP